MIVISDVHLDNGSGGFAPNRESFMKFLRYVGDEKLVIAGDFFDLWRFSFKDIIAANTDIVSAIRRHPNVTLLLGNHDLSYNLMRYIVKDVRMSMKAHGYTIFHGHQIDPLLDTPQERFFASAGARIIQALNWAWLVRLVDKATSGHRSNAPLKRTIENRYGAGRYIVGHSHVPSDDGWFLNAGTWTGDDPRYIKLEPEGARLYAWR